MTFSVQDFETEQSLQSHLWKNSVCFRLRSMNSVVCFSNLVLGIYSFHSHSLFVFVFMPSFFFLNLFPLVDSRSSSFVGKTNANAFIKSLYFYFGAEQ